MNFNRKSTFCIIAFVLVSNFSGITGKPADEDAPTTISTDNEDKTNNEESSGATTLKTKPSASPSSSATVSNTPKESDLPQADQPGTEPNSEQSRPDVSDKPTKESTTEPHLLHSSETSSVTVASGSSSTTTSTTAAPATIPAGTNGIGSSVQNGSTETTPGTTTKGHNTAAGLYAVQFSCLIASAMLVFLR